MFPPVFAMDKILFSMLPLFIIVIEELHGGVDVGVGVPVGVGVGVAVGVGDTDGVGVGVNQ